AVRRPRKTETHGCVEFWRHGPVRHGTKLELSGLAATIQKPPHQSLGGNFDASPCSRRLNMESEQRKQFVRLHRTCIFGYNRRNDGPSMSVTYYMMEDPDTILVSTMAARGKAKAVARNPKVSLCVLDEKWPPTYLQVYCDTSVETDIEAATDLMMKIAGV